MRGLAVLLLCVGLFIACDSGGPDVPTGPDVTGPCVSKGGHCDNSGDCCGTLTCSSGICR